jgi:acetyl esterase/lipase
MMSMKFPFYPVICLSTWFLFATNAARSQNHSVKQLIVDDSLLSRSKYLSAFVNKSGNEVSIYDRSSKKISWSVIRPGDYVNVIDSFIVVIDHTNHTTNLFNKDFLECPNLDEKIKVKNIIQSKINYNLLAGGKKDTAAYWSVMTANFSYKDYDGEVIRREEMQEQFFNARRGLVSVSAASFVKIDNISIARDTAIVLTNQHYVRTEWGNDGKTHEYISNVTHKERWIKDLGEWKADYLQELTEGPYFKDGEKDKVDTRGHMYIREYWEKGMDAFEKKFIADTRLNSHKILFEEGTLNTLGYTLLYRKNRPTDAERIFRINTLAYPHSFNVYDSYAEALMKNNKRKEAIANYRRSLKLFPNSNNAMSMLDELGAPVPTDTVAVWLKVLVPPTIEYLPNVVYTIGAKRELKMNILMPKQKQKQTLPVIMFIHGGGWTEGSKERGVVPLMPFVQKGYVGVSVEYRLSKEAVFPAQIQDIKCAIRFLRANAKKFNIDENNIGVWGQSAGGYLAALVGTSAGIKDFEGDNGWSNYNSEVNAVCDWNGPTDFLADTVAMKLKKLEESAINRLLGGALVDLQEKAKKSNPLEYISASTPPFLILHGENDNVVNISQSELLFNRLNIFDVPVEFIRLNNEGHVGVHNLQPGQVSDGNASNHDVIRVAMEKFFEQYLNN